MILEATITGVTPDGRVILQIDNDDSELIGLVGKKVVVSIQEIYQFYADTSSCAGVDVGEIFYSGA